MNRRMLLKLFFSLPVFFMTRGEAQANRSSVVIEAPDKAILGQEITLRLRVEHRGNSSLHYTDWLTLSANKKEIARWDFTSSQRPEAEVFTREVVIKVAGDLEIVAQANCNIHGSAGPSQMRIQARK